jgi:tetratricopeptide (TPR) repeat protein
MTEPDPHAPASPRDLQILLAAVREAQASQDFDKAECFARLCALIYPQAPAARLALADVLESRGRARQAMPELLRALELEPGNPAARWRLAQLRTRIDVDLAEAGAPPSPLICYQLGRELERRGRLLDAAQHYRSAFAQKPDFAAAAVECALLLHRFGDLDGAIALYGRALAVDPGSAQALCNLALALQGQQRHAEALAAFDAAAAIAPEAPLVHLNRSMLLLLLGRWDEGWEEYEWRWKLPRRFRPSALPRWKGDALKGRNLVLFSELGMGDTIQMARYLSLVVERAKPDADSCILLACQAPLRRLFSRMPDIALIGESQSLSAHDVEMPLSSLPRLFKTRPDSVPPLPPLAAWLIPEAGPAVERVREAPRPRIGLVWAGNPEHLNDDSRSLPLGFLRPLIDGVAASFFSLQKGAAERELERFSAERPIVPLGPFLSDMADTAAAIMALDLVISVDTSVAHLAGALQKPVWLMLPFASEWRWLRDAQTSPWYPSMRIFRQRRSDDWEELVARMTRELAPKG